MAECLELMVWVVALQVRNLASCVKVAVDFVLPESLDQAFKFAKDFANMGKSEAWENDPRVGSGSTSTLSTGSTLTSCRPSCLCAWQSNMLWSC